MVAVVCPRSISGNVLDVRWLDPVDSTSTASTRLVFAQTVLAEQDIHAWYEIDHYLTP